MSVPLDRLDLARGVVAAFTGRATRGGSGDPADPSGRVDPANLAHHRPHVPALLAAARASVAEQLGIEVDDLHLMRQVHGDTVATIDADTPRGIEVRDVDAMVTDQPGRALVVQAADCVPVLVAIDDGPVGVAHAGRAGVQTGIVANLLERLVARSEGATIADVHGAIGPAIGGCCYEVPPAMVDAVRRDVALRFGTAVADAVPATTTWGTAALDLPRTVEVLVRSLGVTDVRSSPGCTRCAGDERWFSHRRAPTSGRHWGVVVHPGTVAA